MLRQGYVILNQVFEKNYLFILILTFVFQSVTGQDKISTKDRQQFEVRVIEKTIKETRYKMVDYEDGPIISMKNSRITKIEYKNGVVDMMGYQNPRKSRPLGIGVGAAVWISEKGAMSSSTLDYFIIPQIDLEINIGTDFADGFYYSAGSRVHLNSNYSDNRLTPFTGLLYGSQFGDDYLQLPVGINYLTKIGLNASLSLNEMFFFNSWRATFVEMRIGWKFKV
jgi:hypothetical protein